ncbi:MAG TPA: efflux RND transporter periplasmic adaptor subunit [bacterium]|nr:efflux RND transporter periplasmic adaptor subunit [bacterium]HQG44738.1 efflux RND transporter periplasmic adaptor subunit [bacterium]HQI49400.1 efflux RND transporter periplasmic adaptor subunit [bacterium]HQJ65326.1 efflux RND transporter periplasmic adaptor subunit [bacterium]
MKRRRVQAGLLLAMLALAGCDGQSSNGVRNVRAVRVEAAQPGIRSVRQAMSYSGTIEAAESIPLSFATVGTVARVLVAEGDAVRKGQLLAVLNEESSRNGYEMALATLKQAEDAHDRLRPMYESGGLPEFKWIEAETNLQKARSAAAISRKNLDDCRLIAPVSGMVGRRSIDPGMAALPNLASITLVRIEKVFARIAVPENEIAGVSKGQTARIRVGALSEAEFSGLVEEIGVVADPLAHSYAVRIGFANPGLQVKPGMICNVLLADSSRSRVLVLPGRAVLIDESGRHYVYVAGTDNLARRREVIPGALLQEGIEIISGIHPDEWVVVAGQHKLADQMPLDISRR